MAGTPHARQRWQAPSFPSIESIWHAGDLVRMPEPPKMEESTANNPKLASWFAVRQEWTVNGGRVTPELLRLERLASDAVDNRNSQ